MSFASKKLPVLLIVFACLACASSAGTKKAQQPDEQMQAAERYIAAVIQRDYKAAYNMFSKKVNGKYTYNLFEQILSTNHKKLGVPVSFAYKSEAEPDPNVVKHLGSASRAVVYMVTFKQHSNEAQVPLMLTFDTGEDSTQLLSYRYLVENETRPGEKK